MLLLSTLSFRMPFFPYPIAASCTVRFPYLPQDYQLIYQVPAAREAFDLIGKLWKYLILTTFFELVFIGKVAQDLRR
jgi:hypothetical protein